MSSTVYTLNLRTGIDSRRIRKDPATNLYPPADIREGDVLQITKREGENILVRYVKVEKPPKDTDICTWTVPLIFREIINNLEIIEAIANL